MSMFYGQSQQICDGNRTGTGNLTNACADEISTESGKIGAPNRFTKTAFAIIAVGLILQGISKSPRSPLMSTYIDDNGTKTKTALYVGIISSMGIFGPAIAFGLGGLFTRIYVTLEDVPISPYHPRWIGAWWIGFLLFGCLSILASLPLLCFPRRLRPPVVLKHKNTTFNFKDFMKDLYELIRNPVYMLMILCGCFDIFAVSAFISFTPKYLETQFALPVWLANILMGMLGILSAGIGTLVGGVIVSKFKFSPLTCLKCTMVTNAIFALANSTTFFLGCSNPRIVNYNNQMDTNSSCAAQCNCDVMDYFPLCGSDGQNYFSPCQAGCTGKDQLLYTNCACVSGNATATPGLCPSDCNTWNLYGFLAMSFIGSFVACIGIMPGFIFVIRSVNDRQKPLALGLGSFLYSILGWLPAPMIFGSIVDSCCKVWSSRCQEQGACAKYDIEDFRIKRSSFEILCNLMVISIQCVVLFLARRKKDWSTEDKSGDIGLHETDGPMGNQRNNFERAPFIDRIYKVQKNQ
ncbi:Solute carrier organic anion transporter family member 2A1 [Mizuhopecten yessoensis]|uniref:Solute carrier organic anion transporter family member n=2 Tax=Mizuhopecten yessoensis TaxID=6573 RepID=A0A210QVK4_MIZYE|nr:Solute carrier organic anion transporter family member 2A1 [Mizuhopecten yessoensis]